MTETLLGPAELKHILDTVIVCDIRWSLTDAAHGRESYRSGHVPSAIFVDLDQDLSDPPGVRGRHPLPEAATFASTLGRLGIGPDDHVVVYDDVGNTISARMWWMLESIGHARVSVLDGGYRAWVNAGFDTEAGDQTLEPTDYPDRIEFSGVVGHSDLEGRTVVDARAPERYRGDFEPVDPKAGHIPGAVNRPTTGNLDDKERFLASEELAARFEGLKGEVVVSCGSGVTACHNALAMKLAGMEMPNVYVGSFSEWSRLDLPVRTGEEP